MKNKAIFAITGIMGALIFAPVSLDFTASIDSTINTNVANAQEDRRGDRSGSNRQSRDDRDDDRGRDRNRNGSTSTRNTTATTTSASSNDDLKNRTNATSSMSFRDIGTWFNQNSLRNRDSDSGKSFFGTSTRSSGNSKAATSTATSTATTTVSVYQKIATSTAATVGNISRGIFSGNLYSGIGLRNPNSAAGLIDIFAPSNQYAGGLPPEVTASATLGAVSFGLLGWLMAAGKFALFG